MDAFRQLRCHQNQTRALFDIWYRENRGAGQPRIASLGEQLGEVLREALAESLHLRDAAVLDAGAVGELAKLVLAAHVVDEVVTELLNGHLGVWHVLSGLGVVCCEPLCHVICH